MNCTVSMISLLHSKLWLKTEWQKWGCLSTPGPRPAWRPCPCRGWEERAASRPPLPVPFPSSLPPLTSPSAWLLEGRQNSSLPWLLLGLTKLMTTFPPPPPLRRSRSSEISPFPFCLPFLPARLLAWLRAAHGCRVPAGVLLCSWVPSPPTPPPFSCCPPSHWPTQYSSLQPHHWCPCRVQETHPPSAFYTLDPDILEAFSFNVSGVLGTLVVLLVQKKSEV